MTSYKHFLVLILLFNSVMLFGQSTLKTSSLTTSVNLGGEIRATTPYQQLIVVSGNQLIVLNSDLKRLLTIPIEKEGPYNDTWCISKYQNVIAIKKKLNNSKKVNYDIWDLRTLKKINNISFISEFDIELSDFQLSEFGSYFVSMIYQFYRPYRWINNKNAYGIFNCQVWYVGKQFHPKQINTFAFPNYNESDELEVRDRYCKGIGVDISDKISVSKFNTYPLQQEFQNNIAIRKLVESSFKIDDEVIVPTIDGRYLYIKSTTSKYYRVSLAKLRNEDKALLKFPSLFSDRPIKDEFMTTTEYKKFIAKYELEQKNGLAYLANLPERGDKEIRALSEIDSDVVNGVREEEALFLKYKDIKDPDPVKEIEIEKEFYLYTIYEYNADKQALDVSILFGDNLRYTEIKLPRDVARRVKGSDTTDTFKVIGKYSKRKLHHIRLFDVKKNKYYNFPKIFEVSDDEEYEPMKG